MKLSYVSGVIYTNESKISLEIRESFSSLPYVITGSDHFHKEIREVLVENMKVLIESFSGYCFSNKKYV